MSKNKSKDKKNDPSSLFSIDVGDGGIEKLMESFRKRYNLKPDQDFKVVLKPIKLNTDKKS